MHFATDYLDVFRRATSASPQGYTEAEIDHSRVGIPQSLKAVYLLAGRSIFNQRHNRLYPPSDLVEDSEGWVAFAEENQNVVIWSYKASEADGDPVVFQKQFDGEGYGPWVAERQQMPHFLLAFAYWNAANGAADFSGVGEVSKATQRLAQEYPVVWEGLDFIVRGNDALFVVTGEGDFYCFGKDAEGVESLATALQVEWFDMG